MAEWRLPVRPSDYNGVQQEFYNSQDGQDAVWQSVMDFYLQGNGSAQARNAMQRILYPTQAKYNEWSFANPTTPKTFGEWLEGNQGGIVSGYNNSSRTNRGGGRGYDMKVRSLW